MKHLCKRGGVLLAFLLLLTGCGGGETNTAPVVSAELPYTVAAAGERDACIVELRGEI